MTLSLSPLFSGSSGNAILISSGTTKILIDAGVSGRRLEALFTLGEDISQIKGILLTRTLRPYKGRRHPFPQAWYSCYATADTFAAGGQMLGSIQSRHMRVIAKTGFYINDLLIEPFDIPHDAADPVAITVFPAARAKLPSRPILAIPQNRSVSACAATLCCLKPTMILPCSLPGAIRRP